MLTRETVMAALPDRVPTVVSDGPASGWSSNGQWATRFVDYPAGAATEASAERRGRTETFVAALTGPRDGFIALTEDESLRIDRVAGIPDKTKECSDCGGTGECECHCGDSHGCAKCDGEGEIIVEPGTEEEDGQAVFRSRDGKRVAVQAKYGDLLRGYSVFRLPIDPLHLNDDDEECRALVGIDDSGEAVVAVMPIRGEPRVPTDKGAA
ncbi:MAG TPA: hypothetical protein VHG72_21720 [Polyangia bacterium]|nr:hypothetical protein [Polyangia bacterium]